jgi:hypothetical protein
VQREHTPPADGLDQEFPADDDATGAIRTPLATLSWVDSAWQERRWQCAILSLVASKADIRQQAIKGGEAPQADIGHVCKLEESDLVGRVRRSTLGTDAAAGIPRCDKDRSRQVLNQLKSRLLPSKKLDCPGEGDRRFIAGAVDIALLP